MLLKAEHCPKRLRLAYRRFLVQHVKPGTVRLEVE